MNKKNIGELLLEYDLINEEDLELALEYQKKNKVRLGEALVALGKITENDIEYILSKQLNIPYVLIDNLILDESLIKEFDKDFLKENRILPLYETDSEISIVTDDPFNMSAFEKIKEKKKKKINLSSGNGSNILKKLNSIFSKTETKRLKEEMQKMIISLQGTNNYRVDFRLFNKYLSIYFFNGKEILFHNEVKTEASLDEVIETLLSLDLKFFYQIICENSFISIFPAELSEEKLEYPIVADKFKIPVPTGTVFSDLENFGLGNVINSEVPIKGYPYISLTKQTNYHMSINLFEDFYGKN